MNKRIVAILWAVLMTVLLFVGCGSQSSMRDRFDVVERYSDCCIIVDKETGIGYLHYGYGISPLYDANGELYRPNGWRDYGE